MAYVNYERCRSMALLVYVSYEPINGQVVVLYALTHSTTCPYVNISLCHEDFFVKTIFLQSEIFAPNSGEGK
jgi:hypothetical protein